MMPEIKQEVEEMPEIRKEAEEMPEIKQEAETMLEINQEAEEVPEIKKEAETMLEIKQEAEEMPELVTKVRRSPLSMSALIKKLTLWHTRTFRPILTHEELEPILEAAGFEPVPMEPAPPGAGVWREYRFCLVPATRHPRPRLPYPCIDGLHIITYRKFIADLGLYLGPQEVPNLFHVRSTYARHDDGKTYYFMDDPELDGEGTFVCQEGGFTVRSGGGGGGGGGGTGQ